MSFDMGYYGSDPYGDAAEYEEFEEQPQQRQRNAPRSPGLRAHMKAISAENKALKKQLDEQKAMLQELMEGDSSPQQPNAGGHPRSPLLTPEEQMQYQRMISIGAVHAAPPMGSQQEQINAIRNTKNPQELIDYLRSQGSTIGTNYEGMGY
ncbi:hypothetical protein [Streptomyces sp. HUAS ZL42]|uniref:hypothetical protein n=1 Tax=Streptomyces sp. HUAS ZL42 TaxID=3231715 RepID=UPI00345E9A81